jgi:hypothetical protein
VRILPKERQFRFGINCDSTIANSDDLDELIDIAKNVLLEEANTLQGINAMIKKELNYQIYQKIGLKLIF